MTKEEKIIVSAYTGVAMTDFYDIYKYIEKKLDRPVPLSELSDKNILDKIKKVAEDDFFKICGDTYVTSDALQPNDVLDVARGNVYMACPRCRADVGRMMYHNCFPHYCCNCGQALRMPDGYEDIWKYVQGD